jgi:hypothetical protein
VSRYRGFAQVEYEHVRERVYAPFDWTTFEKPSPRHRLQRPLAQARVALAATAGAHLPGLLGTSRSDGHGSVRSRLD